MPLKPKLKILPMSFQALQFWFPLSHLPSPTPPVLLVRVYHISFQSLGHTMLLPTSCHSRFLCIGQSSLPWVLRSILSSFESLLRPPLRWSIFCIIPFHGTTASYYHSATTSQYHEHYVHRTYIITGILYLCDSGGCITWLSSEGMSGFALFSLRAKCQNLYWEGIQ